MKTANTRYTAFRNRFTELKMRVKFVYLYYRCQCCALAAIPSLRARDCSKNEKEALNYLFLLIPLLNVAIPFLWKSFAVVWSADTIAFFGMYAWKVFVYPVVSFIFDIHNSFNLKIVLHRWDGFQKET